MLALGLAALAIGVTDFPNGAVPLAQKVPGIQFRYQYLAGGVRGKNGWSHWNPNGTFVSLYVRESVKAGITPVFTYYQALNSSPSPGAEDTADIATLRDASTMRLYWKDLALAFRRARSAAHGHRVVFHIEPDLWGYLMQHHEAKLAGTFARHVVRLRDQVAPKLDLAWHMSVWGTGDDPTYSDPPDAKVRDDARRLAAFYRGLHAKFDVVFTDVDDRDTGFNEQVNNDQHSGWTAADFHRHDLLTREFAQRSGRRVVLWQVPLGNSTLDNTSGHYRDNRVEWWLGNRKHLQATARSGVIAILFGGGADGTTQKDTDGGLFYRLAKGYYARGPVRLP